MKKIVNVITTIEIEIDETKFTEEFMREFKESFYEFDTINDHIKYLAQLYASGFVSNSNDFIEGYGLATDMGINFLELDQYANIE